MKHTAKVTAIILAAGKGTRMKTSDKNKVVFPLGGIPMIQRAVQTIKNSGITHVVVVVGFAAESVQAVLKDSVTYAVQKVAKGTADAVAVGLEMVSKDTRTVLTMYGDDSAFYTRELLTAIIKKHQNSNAVITLLTLEKEDPTGLGRIVRDENGTVKAIVEEKNANQDQKKIREINTGLYCFDREFLKEYLPKIKKNPVSGEYYLTDLIELAVTAGLKVKTLDWPDASCWFGVNTPKEWQEAQIRMRELQKDSSVKL